ncbi:hypothetical protein TNCV_4222441 [Trichonephila clavipes]|nr:hypothetical protein TNCV_4222441 [Trichonephila clavipes]
MLIYVLIKRDRGFQCHPATHSGSHSPVVALGLQYFVVPESGDLPYSRYVRLVEDLTETMVINFTSKARFIVEHNEMPVRWMNGCDTTPDDSTNVEGVKGRRLKDHRERNPNSAKRREMVKGTTEGNEERVHFVNKLPTAIIAASIFAQLDLYVAGDDLLLGMTIQFHACYAFKVMRPRSKSFGCL